MARGETQPVAPGDGGARALALPVPRRVAVGADLRRAWRAPWAECAVLVVLAALMRLPYQTATLYHWDSVLYARALAQFDVAESQPHPPGYLFYVGAARLAQVALGDANASLVAVSVLGGMLAVGLVYLLGRHLYGRAVGVAAGLLLASAPTFWFYSGVAYPYTLLAAGSVGLAGLAVAYWRGAWRHPGWLGLLYGLAGGFRLDLLMFLAPLLVVAHLASWRRTQQRRNLLLPLPTAALGVLLWLLPTVALSQGWAVYWPLLSQQGAYVEGSYSIWSRGWAAFQSNSWQVLVYAWEGVQGGLVLGIYGVAHGLAGWWRAGHPVPAWRAAPAWLVLVLWLAPPALFYALVHIGDRGYSFSYLPGLCIAVAVGARLLARDVARLLRGRRWRLPRLALAPPRARALYGGLLAACVAANLATFLLGHGRISAHELSCLNEEMPRAFGLIREQFDPAETVIFTSFFYQHARYYLPTYRAWWYDPLTRPVFREPIPAGVRQVVVYGDVLRPARQANLSFYPLACGRRLYYYFNVEPGAELVFRPPTLSVGRAP